MHSSAHGHGFNVTNVTCADEKNPKAWRELDEPLDKSVERRKTIDVNLERNEGREGKKQQRHGFVPIGAM